MTCIKPDYQEAMPINQEIKLEDIVGICDTLTKNSKREVEGCCETSRYYLANLKIVAKYQCLGGKLIQVYSFNSQVLECFIDNEENPANFTELEYKKGQWEQDLKRQYEELTGYQNQLSGACAPKPI